jgi:cytochrome d ubiquinol oxidase subunit II
MTFPYTELLTNGHWLPLIFMVLMGVSILVYVILDGYDLGVGILLSGADSYEKDKMIASIGPFWDANETWLVLGVGILLVAFPAAHGIILTNLYLPTAFMLIGLILRGVAFDFRVKVHADHKTYWNWAFFAGSALTATSQGYMLGSYIVGFDDSLANLCFCLLTGVCLTAGYCFVGAGWLIMKTEGLLQKKAIAWAKLALWGTTLGMIFVSLTTPLVSPRIFAKWFCLPNFFFLCPIPLITGILTVGLYVVLKSLPKPKDRHAWVPFAGAVGLFLMGFLGLGYSFFPYIVPNHLTIWDAASSYDSLKIILVGALIVLPFILVYTIYAYRVFWGKVGTLEYD